MTKSKSMTKAEVKAMYPKIQNPTQKQIERAIMTGYLMKATKQLANVVRDIADQHEADVRGFIEPFVRDGILPDDK